MTETRQGWVIPLDPQDLAPLPVLLQRCAQGYVQHLYNRKQEAFDDNLASRNFFTTTSFLYDSFDECRAAMINARVKLLNETREQARQLAQQVEHIRTIPTASFPSVLPEIPEAQQQETEGQKEAKAEEVKPALKRPRKNG